MGHDPSAPEWSKTTREDEVSASVAAKPHVLVVDDDPDVCEAVQEVLEGAGFEAVCVSNGELGLRHLHDHPGTSAVLLDLVMPLMNGWTFVNRVQSTPQLAKIPIVVMTATAPHWGYPASQVLRKPMGNNELLSALRSALARGRAQQPAGSQPR
jgi:two-component system, chemotaxis family, chemotaxis protein CheY